MTSPVEPTVASDRRLSMKVSLNIFALIETRSSQIEIGLRNDVKHPKERGKVAKQKILRAGLKKAQDCYNLWGKVPPSNTQEKLKFDEEASNQKNLLLSILNVEEIKNIKSGSSTLGVHIPGDINDEFLGMLAQIRHVPNGAGKKLSEAEFAVCLLKVGSDS